MFDAYEEEGVSIFEWSFRAVFLLIAVAFTVTDLFCVIFPGVGRDQRFERGILGMLLSGHSFFCRYRRQRTSAGKYSVATGPFSGCLRC